MADVIYFKTREKKSASHKDATITGCSSPIVVDRISKTIVAIDFHKGYFDIPLLERAIQNVAYGEIWDICRAPDDDIPYASYRLVLKYTYADEADEILAGAVEKIAKRAYLEEVRVWSNFVGIDDLVKPYQYPFDSGVNINTKTQIKLFSAGIKTISELTASTRERICSIPGMTTEEVVKLEKSLASRGLFLISKIPTP